MKIKKIYYRYGKTFTKFEHMKYFKLLKKYIKFNSNGNL